LTEATAGRLPRPDAVLFDLDGTLVDTVATRIEAWARVFEAFGIPVERERLGPLIGSDGRRLARESRRWQADRSMTRAPGVDRRCGGFRPSTAIRGRCPGVGSCWAGSIGSGSGGRSRPPAGRTRS
jgi:hypothetical protein